MKNEPRYKAQRIMDIDVRGGLHWRITDTHSNSRIATCYLKSNAWLVTSALNAFDSDKRHLRRRLGSGISR